MQWALDSMRTRSWVSMSSVCPLPKAPLIYSWFLIPSRMANPILAPTDQHSDQPDSSPSGLSSTTCQSLTSCPLSASRHSLCQNCVMASYRPVSLCLQRLRSVQLLFNWEDCCSYSLRFVDATVIATTAIRICLIYTVGQNPSPWSRNVSPQLAECEYSSTQM